MSTRKNKLQKNTKRILSLVSVLLLGTCAFLVSTKKSPLSFFSSTAVVQPEAQEVADVTEVAMKHLIKKDLWEERKSDYILELGKYEQKNISIEYPQIIDGFEYADLTILNESLQDGALAILDVYQHNENLVMEVQPEIVFEGENILSVQYVGLASDPAWPSPTNIFYTHTLDLKNNRKVRLVDIVALDSNFVSKFIRSAKYVQGQEGLDVSEFANMYLLKMGDNELLGKMRTSDYVGGDNFAYMFSYITESGLGISFAVPHAIGDHVEFEIPKSLIE